MEKRGFVIFWYAAWVVTLLFFATGYALADEIILGNGDRLSGRIIEIKDGVLTLETSYSEPIKLKFEAVHKMNSMDPVEIHLVDGEVLKGKIAAKGIRQIMIDRGTDGEEVVVSLDNVTALNPPPKKTATWKGNIAVGGNWQDGNSDTMNLSAGGQALRRSEKDRFLINILYNKAEDDGQRTAENTYGQLKYDYFLSSKWYLYLNIDMLSDDFKDINLRTTVGPGVGYQVWEAEDKALGLEAGVSYTSEDRDTGEDANWTTARIGVNFLYRLFDRVIFTDQFVIYPNLDDTGEYTLRNEAAFVTDMGASWALKLSSIWERNSNPEEGFEKDDFTWIYGLQYSF